MAPVNDPFTCPKNSLSNKSRGTAAQLTLTNGRADRPLRSWIARATSSLPVPDSPRTSTLAVVGRNQLDLLEQLAQRRALADDFAKRVGFVDFLPQITVFRFELPPEPLDFAECPGVGDGHGRLVGQGPQPIEVERTQPFAAEDREHSQNLAAEFQRMTGEADDLLLADPAAIKNPLPVARGVFQQNGLARGADPADLADSQRHALQRAVDPRPIGRLAARKRSAGTGRQMQAACLVRAIIAAPGKPGSGRRVARSQMRVSATPFWPASSTTIRCSTASSVRSRATDVAMAKSEVAFIEVVAT